MKIKVTRHPERPLDALGQGFDLGINEPPLDEFVRNFQVSPLHGFSNDPDHCSVVVGHELAIKFFDELAKDHPLYWSRTELPDGLVGYWTHPNTRYEEVIAQLFPEAEWEWPEESLI